jgi:hypothetical protein
VPAGKVPLGGNQRDIRWNGVASVVCGREPDQCDERHTHLRTAPAPLPYISDAVPGWFQATLALADSSGREVRYADHFLFHPDPVLYYEIPEDGAYVLEIHDSIYRGREDFVYRIEVGELPFVTGIFPLGGRGTDDRLSSSVNHLSSVNLASGGVIPGSVESVRLTLTMPSRPEGPRSLALVGRASIAGHDVRRDAVPAEDMTRLKSWRLWGGRFRLPTPNRKGITVSRGATFQVATSASLPTFFEECRYEIPAWQAGRPLYGVRYLPPMRRITEPISSGVARVEVAAEPLAGA